MFTHLHVHSEFSFLDGASKLRDLVAQAGEHGMAALALTDHDTVAGAVRFQKLAKAAGVRAIVGAEVTIFDFRFSIFDLPAGARAEGAAGAKPEQTERETRTRAGAKPEEIENRKSKIENRHLTLLVKDARGYANLCRILTHAHLSQERGAPATDEETLARHAEGLIALSGCRRGLIATLLRQGRLAEAEAGARRFRDLFGPENFYLEVQNHLLPGDQRLCHLVAQLGERLGIPLVATNNVHYHEHDRFKVQDLLTCMRHLISLDEPHPDRRLNAEYYLKSEQQMRSLFRGYPEALASTERIAERCAPPLDFNRTYFPAFRVPQGETAATLLHRLVYQGARRRYGRLTEPLRRRLEHEMEIIHRLGYDDYFLAVWDIVRWARGERIRCAGRGSAADSAVAYCLGITSVDSFRRGLMFERFMNLERANMPDIDVDFDARHRDDVAKYVYRRYGEEHVASVCTLNRYRARLAIREVGKAMGFPEEHLDRLAKMMPHIAADDIRLAVPRYPELRDSHIPLEKLEQLFDFCEAIADHPKFLGTHLGGLVISREPILDLSPLQMAAKGVKIVQFDKDDVEELGLIKLDLLCLRTLGAVEDATRSIGSSIDNCQLPAEEPAVQPAADAGNCKLPNGDAGASEEQPAADPGNCELPNGEAGACAEQPADPGNCKLQIANCKLQIEADACEEPAAAAGPPMDNLQFAICNLQSSEFDIDGIPQDDPATYERLRSGETIGAFQLESPAQRALQARLGADNIEDIVASVALIRPGPIAGNMVEPFVARRQGKEPVTYLHPVLEKILGKTYGVVLFQEQVIEIAVELAGFTPGEADQLRRLMTHNRSMAEMQALGRPFVEKCVARGIAQDVAETVFGYILGYAGYGFCEAHAAAFGDTAYKTMYLLTHYPAHYYAALLSNQPMGFYSPNTLALEARRRGIHMRLPDVNRSEKGFTVEDDGGAIRVGLKQVEGIAEAEVDALVAERESRGPFASLEDFCRRVALRRNILERMILCGCFDGLDHNRKSLLWHAGRAPPRPPGKKRLWPIYKV